MAERSNMETAVTLLDEMTPVYRGKIHRLPYWERRVLYCLSLLGGWQRQKDVSSRSRMGGRHTSTCLTRLKRKGFVVHENRQWRTADEWMAAWFRFRRHGRPVDVPTTEPPKRPDFLDLMLLATGEQTLGRT